MSDATSADVPHLISRSQSGEVIAKALRLFVGVGKRYSVRQVYEATGVKERAIECAMASIDSTEHRDLKTHELASLTSFFGAPFIASWLALTHLQAWPLGEISYDDLARRCRDFADQLAEARHPDSPGGPAIVHTEVPSLDEKRAMLRG